MGNPHPTKSKPAKIGRKHCGALSAKMREQRRAGMAQFLRKEIKKRQKNNKRIHDYFTGKADYHPGHP